MSGIARYETRWVGRKARRVLRLALATVAAAGTVGISWAAGPAFHANIDRPVLYQGHLYSEGRIELVQVGSGTLLSLRLDGQGAAMIFTHSLGRYRAGGVPEFCFRRVGDALELADIRWSGSTPRGRVEVLMVVKAQVGRAPG